MKKKIIVIITAVVVVALAGMLYYRNSNGLKVELLEVIPQTIANTFIEEGVVVPAKDVAVHSFLGGQIVRLEVEEGQRVKQNDLLAVIDTAELVYQIKQLEAQLKSLRGEEATANKEPLEAQIKSQELLIELAQHNLDIVQEDVARIERLYEEGAVTLKEYEDAIHRLEIASNSLKQQQEALALIYESHDPARGTKQFYEGRAEALETQIDMLRYRIEKSNIVSPIDGIVADLSIKKGDIVNPSLRLMNIFQEDEYQVEAFVPVEFALDLTEGMKVTMTQDRYGEDAIFEGIASKIAPTAVKTISALGLEEQRVKVTIQLNTNDNEKLLPGTVLDVEFITDKREGVLAVPKSALFPHGTGDAVWVVEEGVAKVRAVETGFENNSHVVVEKGLKSGDLIIPNIETVGLKEGKRISIQ
jgi:HlyD family secretion protein